MSLYYVDSSALLKRILDEAESQALRDWFTAASGDRWVSSALADVEVARACRRAGIAEDDQEAAMSDVALRDIDERVIVRARMVGGPELRSLDAIHLATAVVVGVDALVTYDDRLAQAARSVGLDVHVPA